MAKVTTPQIPTSPQWETRSKTPLADGRVPGIDNSLWMWRTVPMSPIQDAKTIQEMLKAGQSLHYAFEQLAELATVGLNRSASKGSYREFQLLLLNVPAFYQAPKSSPIREYLNSEFRDMQVYRRELLFGVKLVPQVTGQKRGLAALRDAIDSVTHTMMYGGSLLSDFDADTRVVGDALSRAGLQPPTMDTLRWADSWWNFGMSKAVPILPHDSHLHYFTSMDAKHRVERQYDIDDCKSWPPLPGEHSISFTSLFDLTLDPTAIEEEVVRWAPKLLDRETVVISVRGLVEPQQVTRNLLNSQKRRWSGDIEESYAKSRAPREEVQAKRDSIAEMESAYARGSAPATLNDCSIIVGYSGQVDDVRKVSPYPLVLDPLVNLQAAAWYETMICSSVRANPHRHDLPATTISYAGLQNVSRVGDNDGALMGFTERDSQPVYLSHRAASAGDAFPLAMVAGGTGSGKTVLLQWLAHQWGLMKVPQVIIDPKRESDLGPAVRASGGQVFSFDEFVHSDGALDPLRFSGDPVVGATIAADMISRVRPWDTYETQRHETAIAHAIQYGVTKGARATGQALRIAEADQMIDKKVVDDIFRLADSAPMFRATFGVNPDSPPLNVSDGITLFMVGRTQFELPQVGTAFDLSTATIAVRTSVNLLRMMVRGAMMSLTGRAGVLHADEAWVLQQAAPDELEQIGRLARQQNVLPILYTQTPSGPLNAGLKNFISRGMVGHILDEYEAQSGMELFGADNAELVRRVSEKEYLSGGAGVNARSLKALWDVDESGERTLLRPAVFFHSDLKNSIAPVEIHIPPSFFKLSSTNPEDVRKREEQQTRRQRVLGGTA